MYGPSFGSSELLCLLLVVALIGAGLGIGTLYLIQFVMAHIQVQVV